MCLKMLQYKQKQKNILFRLKQFINKHKAKKYINRLI